MSFDAHKNFGYSTVATAPSPATTGTSLVVATGDGAKFPAAPFNATVWPAGTQPTDANAEIVRVTAITTDTLTITRAQEGSTARAIIVGDQIANTATAKVFTDIEAAITAGDRPDWSYVVAASDTPADLQARADAICDGTADQAEINTAISTAAALSVGARILLLPGTYQLSGQIDFSPLAISGSVEDGKWVDFDATAATIKAAADMATMVNLAAPAGKQIFSKLNVKIGRIDGNNGSFTVNQGVYVQRFVDNRVWIGELVNCAVTGFFVDQHGVTDHGCFNNIIEIDKLNTNGGVSGGNGFYASSDPDGTSIFGFQGNIVRCGQAHGNFQGFVIGDAADHNAFINRFEIGVIEHSTAYGIRDRNGENLWIVNNTNSNTTAGIVTASSMTKRSTFVVGHVDDTLDSTVTTQHYVLDAGSLRGLVQFVEQSSAPGTPPSGFGRLYEKTDGKIYFKNDGGTEYDLTGPTSVFGRTGVVVAADADYYGIVAAALTGATQAARFVGATTSGAPASGTFLKGDFVVAQNGHIFVCTVAGTPGTWVDVGSAGGLASPLTTKGDVWGYSSADARIPIGSDGQVLTADSTQTLGLKWAAAGAGTGPSFTTGSSPPGSPANGDYWIFPADDTNGVYWMFQYDSSETTYKWRFVGGPPLAVHGSPSAVINSLTQVGATGNYYQASTMSYTLARGGDYDLEFGCRFNLNGASSPQWIAVSAFHGSSAGLAWFMSSTNGPPNGGESATGMEQITGLAAAAVIGVCANAQTNGTVKVTDSWLKVRPIRVI